MKKASIVTQWIFASVFAIFTLANGFHWSSILTLAAAVLIMPVPAIRKFLKSYKINNWVAITLSVVLLFIGVSCSPLQNISDEISSMSSYTFNEEIVSGQENNSSQEADTDKTDSSAENTSTGKPTAQTPVGSGKAEPPSASSIPDYSGNVFIQLNNNIPNFSSDELKTTGYEIYGNLDSLGRVTTAVASLGKDTMPKEGEKRGDISSIKPTGWVQKQYSNVDGKWLYNRSHLIGWQLSAENANVKNLITGTRYFNTNGMLPFENMVADYINETDNHVAYRVTPIFEGNNLLCKGVQIEAYSVEDGGKGISFNVFCYNVQPDININYATGESSSAAQQETTSTSNSGSTTVVTPTPQPQPESTTESTVEPSIDNQSNLVWIPTNGGTKYHSKSSCYNMKDPIQVTQAEAVSRGFEPCKRCH